MNAISTIGSGFTRLRKSKWFSRYTIAFSIFFVWMLFFDRHNVFVQYKLRSSLQQMERKVEAYADEIKSAEEEKYILEVYKEKYAREKYYMHKPDEEVFVIERD